MPGEDDGLVYPGIKEYNGTAQELKLDLIECSNTWVSKGRDFRTQCLMEQDTGKEATAQQSYLTGLHKHDDVSAMYEHFFGCETLINWSETDIDNAFVEAKRPIDSYLDYDQSYGAFFPTKNEKSWVEDAILGAKTLKMHGFFDKQTTEATVYLVTRNLDADALFYTLVKITFSFRVNGYSNVKYEAIFSPMIQYEYGTDSYGWRNRQMYIWEIMFLIIFGLFALREVSQVLFSRLIPCFKRGCRRAPISPSPQDNERVGGRGVSEDSRTKKHKSPSVSPREGKNNEEYHEKNKECVVYDIEKCDSSATLSRPTSSDPSVVKPKSPPRPQSAGIMDLNGDGKDDFEQLEEFMHDLNHNGIDDAEELMELVDEYLPDAAGLLDILDWLTIGIVSLSIYFRVGYITKTSDLHEFFIDLAEDNTYHESMTELIDRFARINDNLASMNMLLMVLVFFGMIQFFRYLSFDRRLGIVTATIKESLGSLLPVLLIFLVVMFAYAVLGTVMYGAHLNTWSNVGKSTSQLFLLILGEFGSYFDIMQINPIMSAIFFWTYIIMALFLLFNMVLAVIFTVYDEKNTEIMAMEAIEKENLENKKDK